MRVYGGAQGVWVDKARTSALATSGVAVGLRHTGRHYADDLDETGIVYHYPRTRRPASRDAGEIEAIKAARALRLPVLVIAEAGDRRRVRLGWVTDVDDAAGVALVMLADAPTDQLFVAPVEEPFVLQAARTRSRSAGTRADRDPEFAFRALRRYRGLCALTGVGVPQMVEAAHVMPVAKGGSDHAGNSLVLNVALHRAFDANLWAIHPDTLDVVCLRSGPSAAEMKIERSSLADHVAPHPEAVAWRFHEFQKRWEIKSAKADVFWRVADVSWSP